MNAKCLVGLENLDEQGFRHAISKAHRKLTKLRGGDEERVNDPSKLVSKVGNCCTGGHSDHAA